MPASFTPPRTPRIGIRVSRARLEHPLFKTHFRVFIGVEEIGIQAISPLHFEDADPLDDEVIQTVTMRRAVMLDRTLYTWRAAIAAGKDDARDVTIVLLDGPGGKPVGIWRLATAVPIRWSGPDLDALSSELAFEELEVTYDRIEWRSSV